MIVTQSIAGTTTLTGRSSGQVNVTAVPAVVSLASVSTPGTFYDATTSENTNAEAWNEYQIQSQLGSNYTMENLSACQTLTDGVVTPVGNGGFGRVRVTNGAVSQILKCDTTKRGGQTYREFVEYTEGTISRYLYDQVEPLFSATPDVDYYSTYNHATSTYTRNAACWAASVDISCVAVASKTSGGTWTRQRGGTLFTPRHILLASHYPLGIGALVRFSNAAGTVETRTIIGTAKSFPYLDITIYTLDSAVTVATPCKIAGSWITQGEEVREDPLGNTISFYLGGVVIHTDQNAKIYAAGLGLPLIKVNGVPLRNLTANGETFADCVHGWSADHYNHAIPYQAMCHYPVEGDSGQPVLALVEGDLVLLWTWTSPTFGSVINHHNGAYLNAMIADSDANASVSTGYTVTIAADPTL